MAAERQMMGSSPTFYSPLHSMAWAGAFGAAAGGAGGSSSPGAKTGYSFGYPPTPPKESPGGGTPASLQGDPSTYHEESQHGGAGAGVGEDISSERVDIKPSADHLMLNMAGGVGSVGSYPVPGARTHKCQDGELIFPPESSVESCVVIIQARTRHSTPPL